MKLVRTLLPVPMLLPFLVSVVPAQAPSPGEFLGSEPGERYTPMARVEAYAREVAKTSPRVRLDEYGRTPEGRPLLLLVVTAEENHARMGAIREALAKLADPRRMAEGESADTLIASLPAVVWLSYNVHGNETSGTEAALVVLHRLASAGDDETRRWLRDLVVLVDPCLNPDGRDRYVNWFNGAVGSRPDPEGASLEHQEPWPRGRTNHWGFDLNRDWAFATQPETRARLPRFVAWTPQVHVDLHEMGHESTYFFFPAEKPVNANLPDHILKWGRRFGQGNAKAFDARGWAYYTAEDFDLFYPGYGDSWPSFNGAIGMTYEQAGHSSAGAAVRRQDGSVLTLRQRVEHHAEASFATIQTAAAGREELLRDFAGFRRTALEEGRTGPVRAFLLPPGGDPGSVDALVETLLLQGIEVHRTTEAFTAERARSVFGPSVSDRTFERGTWVVDLAQPQKRLAKTLLEPRTEIRELYFYDIAAWSLPLAYGVQAFEFPVPPPAPVERVTAVGRRPGGAGEGDARVGWLLPFPNRGALEAMVDLLRRGVAVRSARKDFVLGDRAFARGTLLVRRSENPEDVRSRIEAVGRERGVVFLPVETGFTEKGIDLGSQSVAPVVRPRVALCGGEGTSTTSFGAARFLLDRVLDVPHSVVPLRDLARADLQRFTAVVIPEGEAPAAARENLERFVEGGGVVVALGDAAFDLCGGEKAVCRIGTGRKDAAPAKAEPPPRRPRWMEEREDEMRRRQQPGSIFVIELDPSHPVSFGYREEIAAFKSGARSFDPDGPGIHVALFKDADPLSGYVNDEDSRALKGRSYASIEPRGEGAFVLFADDPNFRGAWRGLTRLFVNAILLLPTRRLDLN